MFRSDYIQESGIDAVQTAFFWEGLSAALFSTGSVHSANSADNQIESALSTRYGPFGLLDHSSQYGLGVLPEPFLVDDSDLEVNELRLDLFDTRTGAQRADLSKAELEKGIWSDDI